MEIKLKELRLENFKGVRSFTLSPNGSNNINIYGANATGKSTLLDSWTWLLFGKNGENRADFDIKPLNNGEPVHNVESSVEAVLDIDGEELALRKVYKEKWARKRGAAVDELTGHTVDHFINGVPVRQRDYQDRIAEIASEDLFRLLTDVRYFSESLKWQDRRQMLLTVCGAISDGEIIASDPQLQRLPSILGKRSVDEYRKIAGAKKSEINAQLKEIPARIDEAAKSKSDVAGATRVDTEKKIADLLTTANGFASQIRDIQEGGEIAKLTKCLREIEGELIALENNAKQGASLQIDLRHKELDELQRQRFFLEQKERECNQRISDASKEVELLTLQNEELKAEWHKQKTFPFTFSQDSVCPTCGQDLPQSQLEDARAKALAAFNSKKSECLEKINSQGKLNKGKIQLLLDAVKADTEEGKTKLEELRSITDKIQSINAEIDSLSTATPQAESPEKAKLEAEKEKATQSIAELQKGSEGQILALNEQIIAINAQIAQHQATLAIIDANYRADARIRELSKQEKDLAREFEELEGNLYLTEQFIRKKVSMLDKQINSKFQYVSFKLFEPLVNGALSECCEACVNGVPYRSMNEAARTNAGIEISRVLSEYHGILLPVFVDGAESVCEIHPSLGQQIRLIVSKDHPSLTVGE